MRVSFAARFSQVKDTMKDEKGRPTRKALAVRKWEFRSEESARNFANRHKNVMYKEERKKKMNELILDHDTDGLIHFLLQF